MQKGESSLELTDVRLSPDVSFQSNLLSHTISLGYSLLDKQPFPSLYTNKHVFIHALKQVEGTEPFSGKVTGITVPHHLVAVDLMAGPLASLQGQKYTRIILLSPDHFKRGKTMFSVPARDFSTCLGFVPLDRDGTTALLSNPQITVSNLFSHEHGVQSLLPFLAEYFPDTPVLPITISIRAGKADLDSLAASLLPLLTEETLIIQSTDFSHYLTWQEAIVKDNETLRALASGDENRILALHQPSHLDSRGAQYVQMKLQRERFGASLLVTANKNSCEYVPEGQPLPEKTTSYIVQVYSPETLPFPAPLPVYVFGGDFFTGRYVQAWVTDPLSRVALGEFIKKHTGNHPVILNLEGVLLPACPEDSSLTGTLDIPRLCMPEAATVALLKDIGCVAVSLANNHTNDFGLEAYARMRQVLERAGISVIEDRQMHEFPEFTLAAFTDLVNTPAPARMLVRSADVQSLSSVNGRKLLAAFVHCGGEFASGPSWREKHLAALLERAGVQLFIGTHPHRDWQMETTNTAVHCWSLGNFFFDQLSKRPSGAFLELAFYPQGTWWARYKPVGNLYEEFRKSTGRL